MHLYFIFYPLIGAIAGFLSGLIGIGGGSVIVPSLICLFKAHHLAPHAYMQIAAATSLATIVITSLVAVRAYHKHRFILWSVWQRLMPGILIGAIIGARIAPLFSTRFLEITLSFLLLFNAYRIFFAFAPIADRPLPRPIFLLPIGFVIGCISAMVGIGGGVLIIPFLLIFNVPMRQASGTSVACSLMIALMSAITYLVSIKHFAILPYSTGYIYWPAFFGIILSSMIFVHVGVKCAKKLNVKVIKKIFSIFLIGVVIKLLFFG